MRGKGDENPFSSVVAETIKLPANSSYGYQIMDRSPRTVTKHLRDVKTHGAITNKTLSFLGYKNDQLYEVELGESEIEQKEPNIFEIFILLHAKLRILELY